MHRNRRIDSVMLLGRAALTTQREGPPDIPAIHPRFTAPPRFWPPTAAIPAAPEGATSSPGSSAACLRLRRRRPHHRRHTGHGRPARVAQLPRRCARHHRPYRRCKLGGHQPVVATGFLACRPDRRRRRADLRLHHVRHRLLDLQAPLPRFTELPGPPGQQWPSRLRVYASLANHAAGPLHSQMRAVQLWPWQPRSKWK